MTYGQPQGNVQIETTGTVPIVTLMVIFGFVIVFALMSTNRVELWEPHALAQRWMDINSFTAVSMQTWFVNGQWDKITGNLPMASMASYAGWQVIGNCYFLWWFGAKVEQKMGAGRYFFLVLLAMFVPYLALWQDRYQVADDTHFYGPLYIIVCVIGASFLFPEPKEINTQWFKQTRGEIFVREEKQDFTKKYAKQNVGLWLIIFVVYEAACWFFSIKVTPGYMTFHWMPTLVALVLGYGMTAFMVWSATGSLQDGALKLMTIRKYNQILKLDVGHEVAIRGTSMAMGLPEERVKAWVAQQKGKMGVR